MIGDEIAAFDDAFEEYLEESLKVTNYKPEDTSAVADDEYSDPSGGSTATDASPITTTGSVDKQAIAATANPWGRDLKVDVEIYLPDDIAVSDGTGSEFGRPSEVERPATGETYEIRAIYDEGNGRRRCAGVIA